MQAVINQAETAEALKPYNLIWDTGKGYISTMCKTLKAAGTVTDILKAMGLQPVQMNCEKRIVVIYL